MKKVVKLTESDLVNIVKKVVKENKRLPDFLVTPYGSSMMSFGNPDFDDEDETDEQFNIRVATDLLKSDFFQLFMLRKSMDSVSQEKRDELENEIDKRIRGRINWLKKERGYDTSDLESLAQEMKEKLMAMYEVTDTPKLKSSFKKKISESDLVKEENVKVVKCGKAVGYIKQLLKSGTSKLEISHYRPDNQKANPGFIFFKLPGVQDWCAAKFIDISLGQ